MKRMTVSAIMVLAALVVAAQESGKTWTPVRCEIGDVRLKGPLGERLDAMIERHVIGTDVDYITAPFQEKTETKGWWQTEFWGKYMHAAMPYLQYSGSAKLK